MSNKINQFEKKHSKRFMSLLDARSKHSTYQEIHPDLMQLLNFPNLPIGRRESARWQYMVGHIDWKDRQVLDIGANTGYFSMAAAKANASLIVAVEGNAEHAEFLRLASHLMNYQSRLRVEHRYFDFEAKGDVFNIVLCLNVLHHLGDDFGDRHLSIEQAKHSMTQQIQQLSNRGRYCWFQLGFNWKGDRHTPLFHNGHKSELIDFVHQACGNCWTIEHIAIFNPATQSYERAKEDLMNRFDEVGEFLNRPLFLLKSTK